MPGIVLWALQTGTESLQLPREVPTILPLSYLNKSKPRKVKWRSQNSYAEVSLTTSEDMAASDASKQKYN